MPVFKKARKKTLTKEVVIALRQAAPSAKTLNAICEQFGYDFNDFYSRRFLNWAIKGTGGYAIYDEFCPPYPELGVERTSDGVKELTFGDEEVGRLRALARQKVSLRGLCQAAQLAHNASNSAVMVRMIKGATYTHLNEQYPPAPTITRSARNSQDEITTRNEAICCAYQNGTDFATLAESFGLNERSIRRIIKANS